MVIYLRKYFRFDKEVNELYIYFKKSNINQMGNIISYLIALITRLKNFTSKDSGIHFIIPNETKFVLQKINIICFPYL